MSDRDLNVDYHTAVAYAALMHKGQVDKQGQPYIIHLMGVSLAGETIEEKIVGILHDTLEDTTATKEDLAVFFGKKVADRVEIVTRRTNEKYRAFIERIIASNDYVALKVKYNDLRYNFHNLDKVTELKIRARLEDKYSIALDKISMKLAEFYK